jgi:hypothetical protein
MKIKHFAYIVTRIFPVLILSLLLIISSTFVSCTHDSASPTYKESIDNSLLQFTSEGHVLGFDDNAVYIAGLDHALRMEFANSNNVQPVAENIEPAQSDINELCKVCYNNIWDKIDIFYNAIPSGIAESNYIIYPGGNPSDISLQYNVPVDINTDGALQFSFDNGYMTESAPFAWQVINGEQLLIDVEFQYHNINNIGFILGDYNPSYTVYIDPTYQWHTFYGSTNFDESYAIAVDSADNIYVTGFSSATWNGTGDTEPLNAHTAGSNQDIVIIKLNSDGDYQWHTFFGSTSADDGQDIIVDSSNNIYIAGTSHSSWNGPASTEPLHAHSGLDNITIIKLNSNGDYQWHTFYGCNGDNEGLGIAVDFSDNVYISGYSEESWDGPGPTAPLNDHTPTVNYDICIIKLNSAGAYQWHTFMGCYYKDYGQSITVDNSANAYIIGSSERSWTGPDSSAPIHHHAFPDNPDIVIIKVNTDGTYQWHTFYGCTSTDNGLDIVVDSSANVYGTGYSFSTWKGDGDTIPIHPHSGSADIDVLKLNSNGDYQWHTFYGSSEADSGQGIIADHDSSIFITGHSIDTWNGPDNIEPLNAFNPASDETIPILKINASGDYQWHTFYGGATYNDGYGIILDTMSNIYACGFSNQTWNGPGDIEPLNTHSAGSNRDIVVIKMNDSIPSVTTNAATNISLSSATLNMRYVPANYSVNIRFAYRKSGTSTWAYTEWFTSSTAGGYIATIAGLDPGVKYDFRAELENYIFDMQGNIMQFITLGTSGSNKPFLDDSGAISTGTMADIGMGNINVLQPQVAANQQAVIYANVVNKGDLVGYFTVTLKINGQVEETRSVEVNGNSAMPVQFTVVKDEPGTYNVDINGKQTSFTVVDLNSNAVKESRTVFIVALIVCSLAALIALIAIIIRRRANHPS